MPARVASDAGIESTRLRVDNYGEPCRRPHQHPGLTQPDAIEALTEVMVADLISNTLPSKTTTRIAVLLAVLAGVLAGWLARDVGLIGDDYFHVLTVAPPAPASMLFDETCPPEAWGFIRPLPLWVFRATMHAGAAAPIVLRMAHATLHGVVCGLTAALGLAAGTGPSLALVAGLVMAVHPALAQPIASLSCAFDLWCCALALLASLLFLTALRRSSLPALIAAVLAAAGALMSKETAFVLPAQLAVLAWGHARGWFDDPDSTRHHRTDPSGCSTRNAARSLAATAPFWIVAGLGAVARASLVGTHGPYAGLSLVPSMPDVLNSLKEAFRLIILPLYEGTTGRDAPWLQAIVAVTVAGLVARAPRREACAGALVLAVLWVLPATTLLVRGGTLIAGRQIYGAVPWFAVCLALICQGRRAATGNRDSIVDQVGERPGGKDRRTRGFHPGSLIAGLGLAGALCWMVRLLDIGIVPWIAGGRVCRAIAAAALVVAERFPATLILTRRPPPTRDTAILFPGGLGPIVACASRLAGRSPPPLVEQGAPVDALGLSRLPTIAEVTLGHQDGPPGILPRAPGRSALGPQPMVEALVRTSIDTDRQVEGSRRQTAGSLAKRCGAAHRLQTTGGVVEWAKRQGTVDGPVWLVLDARVHLEPTQARQPSVLWGRVEWKGDAKDAFTDWRSALLLFVADDRWRRYRIAIDPSTGGIDGLDPEACNRVGLHTRPAPAATLRLVLSGDPGYADIANEGVEGPVATTVATLPAAPAQAPLAAR